MEFKYIGILGLIVFCCYLAKVHKPSLYGWIMTLLCVYIPISGKYPLDLWPGVNLINAFFLALFLLGKRTPSQQDVHDPVQKIGVMWICVLVFSFFISILGDGFDNIGNLLVSLKRLLDPLVIYYFAKRLVQENDQKAVVDGIILSVIFFSGHLFLQGLDIGSKVRVGGFLDQPNAAAAFIAAYGPLLLSSLSTSKKFCKSLVLIAALALCVVAQFQTVSRGGLIGLGLGLLLVTTLSQKTTIKIAVWGLALLMLASPSLLPDKLLSRFEGKSMSGNVNDFEAEASMNERKAVWQASLSMISSNPIGVGLDGFQSEITNYGAPRTMDAHNIYLRVCGEMGIQGLLIFLSLVYQLFKRGWREAKTGENEHGRLVGSALVGGMFAICATNMFSTTMLNSLVIGYVGVLAAIAKLLKVNQE